VRHQSRIQDRIQSVDDVDSDNRCCSTSSKNRKGKVLLLKFKIKIRIFLIILPKITQTAPNKINANITISVALNPFGAPFESTVTQSPSHSVVVGSVSVGATDVSVFDVAGTSAL